MKRSFENSKDAVRYVSDMLRYSEGDLPSITIIPPGKYAHSSATIVITELLEDIEKTQFKLSTITLPESIPDGSSRR